MGLDRGPGSRPMREVVEYPPHLTERDSPGARNCRDQLSAQSVTGYPGLLVGVSKVDRVSHARIQGDTSNESWAAVVYSEDAGEYDQFVLGIPRNLVDVAGAPEFDHYIPELPGIGPHVLKAEALNFLDPTQVFEELNRIFICRRHSISFRVVGGPWLSL